MNTVEQIKKEFMLAGYTLEESEQLANIAIQYDDPMKPVSVTEATKMLMKAMQQFESYTKDVKQCDCYHTRTKTTYLDPATVAYMTGKWPENNGKIESEVGVCWGTKEQEECNCNGDRKQCTFYPEVRKKCKTNYEVACEQMLDITENHLNKNDREQFWELTTSYFKGETEFDNVVNYLKEHYNEN